MIREHLIPTMDTHALSVKNAQIVQSVLAQFANQCLWQVEGSGFLKIVATITTPFSGRGNPLQSVKLEFPVPIVRSGGEINKAILQQLIGGIIGLSEAVYDHLFLRQIYDSYEKAMSDAHMPIPETTIVFNAPYEVSVSSLIVPMRLHRRIANMPVRMLLLQALHVAAYRAQVVIGGVG